MPLTAPAPAVAPVTRERMDVLDAVRGAAVLGILLVNIESLSGWSFLSPERRATRPLSEWDDPIMLLVGILVEGKFYALFSLLFGVGLAVFVDRAEARSADAAGLFRRRLAGLLLIGIAHTLFIWFGDILVTYAILGFGLIPFLRRNDRSLLRWAAGLFLLPIALYAIVALAVATFASRSAMTPGGPMPPVLAAAADHFARGSYLQVIEGNVVLTVANVLRRVGLMFFPRVFGMFLIGLYAGRHRMLGRIDEHRHLLRRIAVWGAVAGLPLSIAGQVVPSHLGPAGAILVEGTATSIAIPALTLSYAAALCLLFAGSAWLRRAFAAPGRTALSNYLMHSVAGVVVFYGVGFGLFGRLSMASAIGAALGMFAVQIVLSRLWLAHASFGPVEWLWRMFTYRRRFPLFQAAGQL